MKHRCHTREHNFIQCPESDTDVTQENTTSCNVENQTQMSHKRTQLHAMSRNRHRCHTREHNFMQCRESDTDVTQENTTSCNVENQTQMSHKRTQLHAMSRIRHRCHTREHNFMQCPETDTTSFWTPHKRTQHQASSRKGQKKRGKNLFQKQTPPCCSRVRPEHSFRRIQEKEKMSNTASDRNSKFRQVPGNDKVAVVLGNRPETQLHNFPPKKDRPDPRTNLCFRKQTTAVIVNMDRAINHSVKWYLYGAKVPIASRNIIATKSTRSLPVKVLC